MVVELAIRLAAKKVGVAVRVDVRDRLLLTWNSDLQTFEHDFAKDQ